MLVHLPGPSTSSYLTLWVGLFDSHARSATQGNGGHSHVTLVGADGTLDMPVGFDDAATFGAVTAALPPGGRALILSDGVIAQCCPGTADARRQFGLDGVERAIRAATDRGCVAALFEAVVRHAGAGKLQDARRPC